MQSKNQIKLNRLPHSEVEIEGEIESRLLELARNKAISKFSENLDIQGFRKGHIPEKVVLEKVGEKQLLEEAAEIVINEEYPKILEELKLKPVGRPEVQILKLAFGNPLSFRIKTAILPEFELPDYKEIGKTEMAKKEEAVEVNDKEVEDVLTQLQKNKAHSDWHRVNPKEEDHSKHPDFEKLENLPVLDDKFAQEVGKFKDLAELREKVKENVKEDKKNRASEKKRAQIMEELLKKTEIELPEILIQSEVEKSLAQIKDDLGRISGKFEDYLGHIKKTEEDLKKDLRNESEKRGKIQLIFNKIAEVEGIQPNKEILEAETRKIIEYYPEANELNARIYIETQLTNQEVLKLLTKDAKISA